MTTFAGIEYPKFLWVLPSGTLANRLARYKRKEPKITGGYYKQEPGKGNPDGMSFYLDSDFQPGLRWTWADDVEGARIDHTGWFMDEDGFNKIRGLVFRLPRGRGFLAAWSMGEGMASEVDYRIWDNEVDAARAADESARDVAEREMEHSQNYQDEAA